MPKPRIPGASSVSEAINGLASVRGAKSGDALVPESSKSKEHLGQITQYELDPVAYKIAVEGRSIELRTPPALITTNLPAESPFSLNEKVPVVGVSSFRNDRNREDLEGARARVIVADYGEFGRVVTVNSPASKGDHLAQDALAHTLATNVETGEPMLGMVIADGNTNVYVRENLVPKGMTPLKVDKKAGVALIPGTGSARFADIPARNAFRIPAFSNNLPALAEVFVASTDRNPDYIGVFGGATAQMLGVKLDLATRKMQVEFLGLGEGSDFGDLSFGVGATAENAHLFGNSQDLSFEGRVPGSRALKMALTGEEKPLTVIQMTCDGIAPLLETFPDGVELLDVLYGDPEALVGYLGQSRVFGNAHDDESLIIYVPALPEAVSTLQVTAEETVVPLSAGAKTVELVAEEVSLQGDADTVEAPELVVQPGDDVIVFEPASDEEQAGADFIKDKLGEMGAKVAQLEGILQGVGDLVGRRLRGEKISTKDLAQALGLSETEPEPERSKGAAKVEEILAGVVGEEEAKALVEEVPIETLGKLVSTLKQATAKNTGVRAMVDAFWNEDKPFLLTDIEKLFGITISQDVKNAHYKRVAEAQKAKIAATQQSSPAEAPTTASVKGAGKQAKPTGSKK